MEIDVTYCKFARLNDVCASPINTQECKCSKIPIQMCYYKQLQELKEDYAELLNRHNESFDNFQQLKADNEELKNQIKGEINATQKWYQEHTNEKFKADKYKNALDEIEEIIFKRQKEHYCYCDECSPFKEILQKIKEVKGE